MKSKFALLLALCLVFAAFSGCGGTAPAESIASSANTEASSAVALAPETTIPAASAEENTVEESAAESLTEAVPEENTAYEYMFPLSETVTLTYMNTFNPSMMTFMEGQQDVAPELQLEELTNVHIDYMNLSPDVFAEQLNMALVSNDIADIIQEGVSYYSGGGASAVEDGYFVDLSDYLEHMPCYQDKLENSLTLRKSAYTDAGTIPAVYSLVEANNVNGVIIRQDWLDTLGLETPRTYSEIENVLKAMKSELDVAYPLILPMFLDYQYNMFSGNYGMPGSFDLIGMSQQLFVVDGEVRYAQYTNEYESYVSMIAGYYADGLLDPDFVNYEMVRDYQDKINNSEVGLYLNSATNIKDTTDAMANTGAVWAGIQSPVLEEGQINHFTTYAESVSPFGAISVTTSCENIEIACEWLDYRMTPDMEFLFDFGVEGQTFNYDGNGNVVWTDLILNNPEGLTITQALTMYTGNDMGSSARQQTMYTDYQKDAVTAWTTDVDGAYVLPDVTLPAEVSSEASALLGDIRTYISEASLQFVVGDRSLNEFADFRAKLQNMGIERVIEIYQEAYDEYMAE